MENLSVYSISQNKDEALSKLLKIVTRTHIMTQNVFISKYISDNLVSFKSFFIQGSIEKRVYDYEHMFANRDEIIKYLKDIQFQKCHSNDNLNEYNICNLLMTFDIYDSVSKLRDSDYDKIQELSIKFNDICRLLINSAEVPKNEIYVF